MKSFLLSMETIVLYLSPGIGHLISMVELGKLFLSHNPSISITILLPTFPFNTGSTSSYISSVSSAFPSISFHSLPAIPLLQGDPTNYVDMEEITFETLRSNNPYVLEFFQSLKSPVSAFIIDFFCYPALDIARSFNIPTYFFLTSGAGFLAFGLNFPVLDKLVAPESYRKLGNKPLPIPGLFTVPASDMLESMLERAGSYDEFVKMAIYLPKSDGILVNTFELVETRAVQALNEGTCLPGNGVPPVYCVGPLLANRNEGEPTREVNEKHESLSWLDSQPSRSVVYLGFGSRGMFTEKQLKEIAVGLENSGARFLWVIRAPPTEDKAEEFLPPPEPNLESLLPVGFLDRTKGRGLVVKSWVPQISILAHEAIGGFVSHCGWNSVLEAVDAGVPMVAWPLYAEQRFNKILLVDEIKNALPMNESEDRFVSWDEIEKRVKQIINLDEGDPIRKRVLELRHEAKASLREGGSSRIAFARFFDSLKR